MLRSTERRAGGWMRRLVVAAMLLASAAVFADKPGTVRRTPKSLGEHFLEIDKDPKLRARIMAEGQRIEEGCSPCHGKDGNSLMADVPNLAGQNAVFLVVQMRKLASGQRLHDAMSAIVKGLEEDERISVSYYLSKQAVNPPAAERGKGYARGEDIFKNQFCIYCHGPLADGGERIPRLAGQQRDYLRQALTQYRDRAHERKDAMMTAVLRYITDADIAALVDYLVAVDAEAQIRLERERERGKAGP